MIKKKLLKKTETLFAKSNYTNKPHVMNSENKPIYDQI
jgi:hypothetical protein